MNEYEMLYIVHARRSAEETTAVIEWVDGLITSADGEILSSDSWGRRRFAYTIDHEAEGTYALVTMKLPPEAAKELESQLVISEDVVRHMLIKGIVPFDGPEPQRLERPITATPAPAPAPIAAPDDGGAGGPVEGEAATEPAAEPAAEGAAPDAAAAPEVAAAPDEAGTPGEVEAATEAVGAEEPASPATAGAE